MAHSEGDHETGALESCSSESHDTSASEGEYVLSDQDKPMFDFSCWSPEGPAGLQYLSLLPINQGYEVVSPQEEHVNKLKPSQAHRRARHKLFLSGSTIHRDIVDERKLRQAANEDDLMTVLRLLDSGVDPKCMDDKLRTPLHFAASRGHHRIIGVLLDHGADPNQKDRIGNTALHLAACTNHIKVVTLLLKAGTDVHSLDNAGRSPLHLAQSRLRILQKESDITVKDKVMEVTKMMEAYLSVSGKGTTDEMDHLNKLCQQLELSNTREEVGEVNDLLADFTNLAINKNKLD